MQIGLQDNEFILSHRKVMFWKQKEILILADLHLTKETHFRKHGIAVPAGITLANLKKLDEAIEEFSPKEILFLGDLFHSDENKGIRTFIDWKKTLPGLRLALVEGNHDIMHREIYESMQIELLGEQIVIENMLFSHKPMNTENMLNFCGHVHPSVMIQGRARQSLRLPCFHFNQRNFILPAFGAFTGTKSISPEKQDMIYAVAEKEVIRIQ